MAKDGWVVLDEKRVQLSALPVGATVGLSLHVDRMTVGGINAKSP